MKREVVPDKKNALKIAQYGYSVLLLIVITSLIEATIYQSTLVLIGILITMLTLLWIPFKKKEWVVNGIVTSIGVAVLLIMVDDSLSVIKMPDQPQVISLTRYLLKNLLIIFLYGTPAVIVWTPFRWRTKTVLLTIAATCIHMIYLQYVVEDYC